MDGGSSLTLISEDTANVSMSVLCRGSFAKLRGRHQWRPVTTECYCYITLLCTQPPPQATTCGGRNTSRCRCYWAQRTSLVRGYIDGKHRVTVATTCEFTPFHNGCRLWDTATTPTVSSELASVQDDHPICPFLVSLPDSSLTRSGWSDGTSEPAFSQLPALLFGPGCRHLCRVSERICAGQPSAANGDTSETRCFWRKSSP
jgi:hypothetical protein